jgi:hypothetical protein
MNGDKKSVILIVLLAGLCVEPFLVPAPSASAEVTALDMLMEAEGYTLRADLYTYPEYVAFMEDIGVVPSNFILGEHPVTVILASYQRGEASVWQEVFEFATPEAAEDEYRLQAVDQEYISGLGYQGNNGPLYQRFLPRERVFVHGRFLFLFFYSPLDDMDAYGYMDELLPQFISHILDTLGTSPPEPSAAAVDATWGVEPGDTITWHVTDATFTGSMGTGTSSSQGEWDGTWVIADVQGGHILVKQRSMIQYVSTEDETRIQVNVPYDSYTWHTADDDGVSIASEDGSPAGAVIFPLELNGVPLADLVYASIENLPEREITVGDAYVTVHGKTRSYSGFTPIETSWKDLTVHRGTGIVTSSDFYYNNNEYSITVSTGITLTDTSFELSSRVLVTLSLAASTTLSTSTLTEGTPLTVTVDVTDQDGSPVSDAEVAVSFDGEDTTLAPQGSGSYEATLSTEDLEAGTYDINVVVEKEGYQAAADSGSVGIQQRASQPESPSAPSGQTGIPGFPGLSIALGAALATFVATLMRRNRK